MVRISRARLDMEDGRIDQAVLKDYGETLVGGTYGTEVGSVYCIDLEGCRVGTGSLFLPIGGNKHVNAGSGINVANGSFSVSAWARRISTGATHYILGQGTNAAHQGLHFGFRATNVFTLAFFSNDLNTTATYVDTDWHHWVGTYDAGTNERIIYRDGVSVASGTATADYQGSGTFYIGRHFSGSYFDGFIDDVRVYGTVLTPTEVATLANRTGDVTSNLLGRWKFDEGKGTVAADSSGNGNNGTLTNGPIWAGSGGNIFHLILTDNCTFTFSSAGLTTGAAYSFTILLKQDGVGSRIATWPATVSWVAGAAPTLTTAKYRYDILTFTTYDGGARWYGFVGSQATVEKITPWGMGLNTLGRVGDNTATTRSSPVQLGALTNWVQLSAGQGHSGAIKNDGTLWMWGYAANGRLGNNTSSGNVSSPVQIGALTDWKKVNASMRSAITAAIKTDGTLWTWGNGTGGQIGNNSTASRSSPAQVGALTDWADLWVSSGHTLAVKTDGTLWVWGYASSGRLGNNTAAGNVSSPAQLGALTNWYKVAGGASASLALKTDGTIWSWGDNTNGRLGLGDTAARSSPTQIGALTDWAQISTGQSHTLALKTDGTLWAWGNGGYGQLGHSATTSRSSPAQLGTDTHWVRVSAGAFFSFALRNDGTLWTWGQNTNGQLGQNHANNISSPTQLGSLTTWHGISAGNYHTILSRWS